MGTQKTKLGVYLFNLAALIGFLSLLIYSLTSREVMVDLFSYASYYLIFLLVILWVVQTVLFLKNLNFSLKLLLKKYWLGILTAFILTSLVFASVRVRFKTLSDETNLLSISRSMLNDKTIVNSTMGKFYYNNLNTLNSEIPKRPLIFPFVVHLLHTLAGFQYQNAFIVNFIVMFLFLSGVYIAVRKGLDSPSAVAAMFLILSYPVFTVFGTSAGFDLLNSVFFVLVMTAAYYFVKNPSAVAFSFVFASLLVFSNIRYESIAFLLVLPLLLIKKIKWHYLRDCSYLYFITPLVSLPYIWQRIIMHGHYQNPEGVAVFSVVSLAKNLKIFFQNLVDFEYFLPYAGFVSIISMIIFIYLIIEILRKKIWLQNHKRYYLAVLFASVSISSLIYFAHFFGVYNHPSSARLFITLSIVFALGPVALRIFKPKLLSGQSLLIVSVMCFLFYHPIAVEGRFINSLSGNRRAERCMDFISKIKDKNVLIISQRPGQFTALGYGAVNFPYANKNRELVLREVDRRLFSKVFVFQEVEYETNKLSEGTVLHPDYKLNTLYEIQITATEFLRISEVKINEAPVEQ